MTSSRPISCFCRTAWIADLGHGEQPVGPQTAAMAAWCGLPVRLGDASSVPMRPMVVIGVSYGSSKEWVEEKCGVCGWPTRMGRSE